MENKIKLSAELDTVAVEKKISDLQSKLKNIRETAPGGPMGKLAEQYRASGQEERAKRLEEIREKSSVLNKKQLTKELEKQEKELDKHLKKYELISKLQSTFNQNGKAYEESLKKQSEILDNIAKSSDNIAKARKLLEEESPGGEQTGSKKPGFQSVFKKGLASAAGIGLITEAIASAVNIATQIAVQEKTKPERAIQADTVASRRLSQIADLQESRRGYEFSLYGEERQKAIEVGRKRIEAERLEDEGTLTSAAIRVGGGAYIGFKTGTLFGGPIGGAVGSGIGAGIGLASVMADERKRAKLFDKDYYEKLLTAEGFKAEQKTFENLKVQNFDLNKANEFFQRNQGQFLSTQRQFGMSDEDLFKGKTSLLQRGAKEFTTDTILNKMNQISQAGGSSQMGREGSILAAQMERGLNLTNSGSILGKISGATGLGVQESKDQAIRMLSEATKIGLDTSNFAKETRTFLDTTTSLAYQSGASFQEVGRLLGAGMLGGPLTERGIQASQTALQDIVKSTGEMGGLTGQRKLAFLTSKEVTAALGGKALDLNELAKTSSFDVTRWSLDNDYVQTLLERREIDTKSDQANNIVSMLQKGTFSATLKNHEQEKALKKLAELRKNPLADPKQIRHAESRIGELAVTAMGEEEGRKSEHTQKSLANIGAGILGGTGYGDFDATQKMFDDAIGQVGNRAADKLERGTAQDDLGQLERLTNKLPDLEKAFDNVTKNTGLTAEKMAFLNTTLEKNKELFEEYAKIMMESIKGKSKDPPATNTTTELQFPSFRNFGPVNRINQKL
jgi:hypothetical protein